MRNGRGLPGEIALGKNRFKSDQQKPDIPPATNREGCDTGIIMGDVRKGGRYSSYQAEIIARMPKSELRAVLIKAQHNVCSNAIPYGRMKLPKIMHEYIVLWQRLSS